MLNSGSLYSHSGAITIRLTVYFGNISL